ncbi:hypothetical protein KIN20_015707 [Parelaphostrongylus tenuis]|uniref:Uncharacterized protein n=1 Tax=Parelaphostrongylus tenuis TaxID=148309 RepID=A0AAD5QSN1_PARTN|nr:hypothetical protein KIN20_015707 [Parelaphostrongylus tenuis]
MNQKYSVGGGVGPMPADVRPYSIPPIFADAAHILPAKRPMHRRMRPSVVVTAQLHNDDDGNDDGEVDDDVHVYVLVL